MRAHTNITCTEILFIWMAEYKVDWNVNSEAAMVGCAIMIRTVFAFANRNTNASRSDWSQNRNKIYIPISNQFLRCNIPKNKLERNSLQCYQIMQTRIMFFFVCAVWCRHLFGAYSSKPSSHCKNVVGGIVCWTGLYISLRYLCMLTFIVTARPTINRPANGRGFYSILSAQITQYTWSNSSCQ